MDLKYFVLLRALFKLGPVADMAPPPSLELPRQ